MPIREIRGSERPSRGRCNLAIPYCLVLFLMTGCAQVMDDQPKLDPQEAAPFFADGVTSRRLPDHSVAADPMTWQVRKPTTDQAAAEPDSIFLTGRKNGEPVDELPASLLQQMSLTELLQRGQQRFGISCVPCHDAAGTGNGMVARRGFYYPPTYHSDRLRSKPIGYFFIVDTEGHNKMPAYGDLISTEDRWAIAAYVRALQFSRHADVKELEDVDLNALKESP